MLFPTHLLVAASLSRVRRLSPAWLVGGAALPDLLDKPLGMLGVFDLFQTVGHSALLAILMLPLALYSRAGAAVAVGWLSHLLLDVVHIVINGRPTDALFLGWPLVVPPDPLRAPPGPFVAQYLGTPSFYIELGIWLVLGGAFVAEHVAARRAK